MLERGRGQGHHKQNIEKKKRGWYFPEALIWDSGDSGHHRALSSFTDFFFNLFIIIIF